MCTQKSYSRWCLHVRSYFIAENNNIPAIPARWLLYITTASLLALLCVSREKKKNLHISLYFSIRLVWDPKECEEKKKRHSGRLVLFFPLSSLLSTRDMSESARKLREKKEILSEHGAPLKYFSWVEGRGMKWGAFSFLFSLREKAAVGSDK